MGRTKNGLENPLFMPLDEVLFRSALKRICKESIGSIFAPQCVLTEIKKTLAELERVRTSNNIKHITEVSNNLYSLISHPDKMEGEAAKSPTYQALINEISDTDLVKKEFDVKYKSKRHTNCKITWVFIKCCSTKTYCFGKHN